MVAAHARMKADEAYNAEFVRLCAELKNSIEEQEVLRNENEALKKLKPHHAKMLNMPMVGADVTSTVNRLIRTICVMSDREAKRQQYINDAEYEAKTMAASGMTSEEVTSNMHIMRKKKQAKDTAAQEKKKRGRSPIRSSKPVKPATAESRERIRTFMTDAGIFHRPRGTKTGPQRGL